MSDLLRIGSSAIGAYRSALAVVGDNVANASTDGFVRRSAVLSELPPSANGASGVRIDAIRRDWDEGLAASLLARTSDASRDETLLSGARAVEAAILPDGEGGPSAAIGAIYDAMTRLSSAPDSPSLRRELLGAIDVASTVFNAAAASLEQARDTSAGLATLSLDEANAALGELAEINQRLRASATDPGARPALEDARDAALLRLASELSIDRDVASDGSVTVRLDGLAQPPLLDPRGRAMLRGEDGRVRVAGPGGSEAVPAASGRFAGAMRSIAAIEGALERLDALALRTREMLDTHQARGGGPPLLDGTDARSLRLATRDPRAIVTGSGGVGNDAFLATLDGRASAGLGRDSDDLVTELAQEAQRAERRHGASAKVRDEAALSLDRIAGVDLDREASQLIALQQAYSAAARVIDTARSMLDALLAVR